MTTVDPNAPQGDPAEPPRMLPKREAPPLAETLRGWPIVLLGAGAVGTIAAVTILPGLWKGDPAPSQAQASPLRLGDPHGLRGLPTDYSQVEQPPANEPKQEEPRVEPRQEERRAVVQGGGRRDAGPTRAELLRAARMADLAPVGIGRGNRGGVVQANAEGAPGGPGGRPGGPGAQGGRMYSKYGLT